MGRWEPKHNQLLCMVKSWAYKQVRSILFSLKLTFLARKIRILESIFLQNKNWLRVQAFVYTNFRLVRISLFISAITKSFAFFSGKLFYKSNRKLSAWVCTAWYKDLCMFVCMFLSAKQRLGKCITLFSTFLSRRCTTATWNFLISRTRKLPLLTVIYF